MKGDAVSATVLYMSMSLDGFIAGPNEGPGNGLGDGGHRLHEWAMAGGDVDLEATRRSGGANGKIVDECMSTGAVVAGRGTFEPAGGWGAITTTACRSSSSPATSPASTYRSGRWSPT
jgi:dihydrofolate reductase